MFIHEVLGESVSMALCYGGRSCQVLKPGPGTVLGNCFFFLFLCFAVVDWKVRDAGRWCTGL